MPAYAAWTSGERCTGPCCSEWCRDQRLATDEPAIVERIMLLANCSRDRASRILVETGAWLWGRPR